MRIRIYLNRTYKNSCNLIMYKIKTESFHVIKNSDNKNVFTINNVTFVDEKDLINSIEFINQGFSSSIEFSNLKIEGTDISYLEDCRKEKYFYQVIEELKKIESEEK